MRARLEADRAADPAWRPQRSNQRYRTDLRRPPRSSARTGSRNRPAKSGPGLHISRSPRGVLTVWDTDAFLVLCEALARYHPATQLVNGSALQVQGGSRLMKNPALQVQAEAKRTFLTTRPGSGYPVGLGVDQSRGVRCRHLEGRGPPAQLTRWPRRPDERAPAPRRSAHLEPRNRHAEIAGVRALSTAARAHQRGDHFCEPRDDHAVAFCHEICVHTKDRWACGLFILSPWQRDGIVRPLFGEVRWDDEAECYVRRYRADWIELARNGTPRLRRPMHALRRRRGVCGDLRLRLRHRPGQARLQRRRPPSLRSSLGGCK